MRIYEMTATFGKLEHETLKLQPGLNVIEAPNEWGKSTWCAFLTAMLYGLDTRVKTTKTALADKERYAPWSGSPMAGRIDLNWNGRDITIERKTKGRVPLGQFRAYETESGLEVPELTAANCGQMLLGVEQSVFRRAGFIKLTDLPVTQDEALRRRLNALVTTGDDSGAQDRLAKSLRDLKNRCRYNKSGLLPQAEGERDALNEKIRELHGLRLHSQTIRQRQSQLQEQIGQLENHQIALKYAQAQETARKIAAAEAASRAAAEKLAELEAKCALLPSDQEAEEALEELNRLQQSQTALHEEWLRLPPEPEQKEAPPHFRGMTAQEAVAAAQADRSRVTELHRLQKRQGRLLFWYAVAAALCIAALLAAKLAFHVELPPLYILVGAATAVAGITILALCAVRSGRWRRELDGLYDRHPGQPLQLWIEDAQAYACELQQYLLAKERLALLRRDLGERKARLEQQMAAVCRDVTAQQAVDYWSSVRQSHKQVEFARQEAAWAESHADALRSMEEAVQKPRFPDHLTASAEATQRVLAEAGMEQKQLQLRLGQYHGRMEALGDEAQLQKELERVNCRIQKLEDTFAALTIAQQTLTQATQALQRRFAPRISARAKDLLTRLTDGRYNRLALGEDLSVRVGAEAEDVLHDAWWRSDGTVDQLYLALRLAVAEELTPEAPLVLDDALVRFDDHRTREALDVLCEMADGKQVLLFTCQSREQQILRSAGRS